MNALYPVILPVPEKNRDLSPKQRVAYLSRHARRALMLSAKRSRVDLGDLEKNTDGVPLPSNGYYWSITHKPFFVGGVVSTDPVGLDLEEIRSCNTGLFKKVAVRAEWALSDADPFVTFYRYWTAKEAFIKLKGTGIKDMLKCRIIDIPDEMNLVIHFNGRLFSVEHVYFDGHIASIVKNDLPICWQVVRM